MDWSRAVSNELVSIKSARTLTTEQYRDLADVPPELEWLANITNAKTRRAYKVDVAEFMASWVSPKLNRSGP
jgi:hypothetical protein